MNFLKRYKPFIVPLSWLVISAIFLSRAFHDGQLSSYLAAFGFAGVALLFYAGRQKNHSDRNTLQ